MFIHNVVRREDKKIRRKVNSRKLVKKINSPFAIYLPSKSMGSFLKESLDSLEVVVVMGAGDIYNLVVSLVNIDKEGDWNFLRNFC